MAKRHNRSIRSEGGERQQRPLSSTFAHVEAILATDPAGIYSMMDEGSRLYYLYRLQQLARITGLDAEVIATKALRCAEIHASDGSNHPSAHHIGFYIIGPGLRSLIRTLSPSLRPCRRLMSAVMQCPLAIYWITMTFTFVIQIVLLIGFMRATSTSMMLTGIITVIALPVISTNSSVFTQRAIRRRVAPRVLPKIEFDHGIPFEHKTLIVIPAILSDLDRIRALSSRLALLAKANPDANLHFALITDYKDANSKNEPEDRRLIEEAKLSINDLNRTSNVCSGNKFFLLHRERLFNPSEGRWIGWERKRGKLSELNQLLRDPLARTSFRWIVGDINAIFPCIRYVITLDEDSWLESGAADHLIRTAAHPLNKPYRVGTRIVEGYGVLQPAVIRLRPRPLSAFGALTYSETDVGNHSERPFLRSIQFDVFGCARYEGKGLYHVDAFHNALDNFVADNTLLNHDQVEGYVARTGYVGDVHCLEQAPARYFSRSIQIYRWTRGSIQTLPWIMPFVRNRNGRVESNPINVSGRLAMIGVIRNYTMTPMILALLLLGWAHLTAPPYLWVAVVYFGSLMIAVGGVVRWTRSMGFHWIAQNVILQILRLGYAVTILPHHSMLALEAVARTTWRMLISRRNMLEWVPQYEVERSSSRSLATYLRIFTMSSLIGLATLSISLQHTKGLIAPIALLWIAAGWIVWMFDQTLLDVK